MDDGFAAEIETRVHDDGNAGDFSEFVDEAIVERIDFTLDGLRAGAAVDVRNAGDDATFFRADLRGKNHEWGVVSRFEIFGRGFFFERRGEGAPPFAELDGVIHLGIHFRIARISDDGTGAKSARTELHAALKPA